MHGSPFGPAGHRRHEATSRQGLQVIDAIDFGRTGGEEIGSINGRAVTVLDVAMKLACACEHGFFGGTAFQVPSSAP